MVEGGIRCACSNVHRRGCTRHSPNNYEHLYRHFSCTTSEARSRRIRLTSTSRELLGQRSERSAFILGAVTTYAVAVASYVAMNRGLLWWRGPPKNIDGLRKSFSGAFRARLSAREGERGAEGLSSPEPRSYFFAGSVWVLMPILARAVPGGSSALYGVMLGAVGARALIGAPQSNAEIYVRREPDSVCRGLGEGRHDRRASAQAAGLARRLPPGRPRVGVAGRVHGVQRRCSGHPPNWERDVRSRSTSLSSTGP